MNFDFEKKTYQTYLASINGYVDVVTLLVHANANLNFQKHDGRTALMLGNLILVFIFRNTLQIMFIYD